MSLTNKERTFLPQNNDTSLRLIQFQTESAETDELSNKTLQSGKFNESNCFGN